MNYIKNNWFDPYFKCPQTHTNLTMRIMYILINIFSLFSNLTDRLLQIKQQGQNANIKWNNTCCKHYTKTTTTTTNDNPSDWQSVSTMTTNDLRVVCATCWNKLFSPVFPNVCVCQVFQQRFSPAQTLLQLMMLPGHVSPEFSPALTLHTRFTA